MTTAIRHGWRPHRILQLYGKTEFTVRALSVDGNQTIGNLCDQFVTNLPLKLTKPKTTTFLTWAKSYQILLGNLKQNYK